MNSISLLKKVTVASLLGGTLLTAACKDEPENERVREVSIRLVTPENNSRHTWQNDVDPATPGIQIKMQAQVAGIDSGNKVVLKNKSLSINDTITSTIYNSYADFSAVSLVNGLNYITISATDGENSASAFYTILATEEGIFCQLESPKNGATITTDSNSDMPYFQSNFTAFCQGDATSDGILYLSANNGTATKGRINGSGYATFNDITLDEGKNVITINLNSQPEYIALEDCNDHPEMCSIIKVNTKACSLKLNLQEGQTYLFRNDQNLDASDGLQLPITVTTDCPAEAAISLIVANSEEELSSSSAISYSAPIEQLLTAEKTYLFDNVTITGPGEDGLVTKFIQAVATDDFGSRSRPIAIRADGMPPLFQHLYPADKAVINNSSPTLEADVVGIESYQDVAVTVRNYDNLSDLIINKIWRGTKDMHFKMETGLSAGSYQLTLMANDAAGNVTQLFTSFIIDDVAPIFTIGAPFANGSFNGQDHPEFIPGNDGYTLPVIVSVDPRATKEADNSLIKVAISLNNSGSFVELATLEQPVTGQNMTFDFGSKTFPAGQYQMKVVVTDAAGNSSEKLISLNLSLLDHQVTINSSSTCATSANMVLSGAVTPAGRFDCSLYLKASASAEYSKLPLSTKSNSDGSFSFDLGAISTIQSGTSTIKVICEDDNGIVGASNPTSFIIDNSIPVLSAEARFISHSDGQRVGGSSDTDSEEAGIQQNVVLYIPADPNEQAPNNMFVELVAMTGETELYHNQKQLYDGSSLTFKNVTILADGEENGTTKLSAYLLDCAGNRSEALSIDLNIQTSGPVINQIAPLPTKLVFDAEDDVTPASYNDTAINFSYRVTGVEEDALASLTFNPACMNNVCAAPLTATGTLNNGSLIYNFEKIPFAVGEYTATMSVADSYGNSATYVYKFTVNEDANKISITSPADTFTYSNASDVNKTKAGYQGNFVGLVYGYASGSTVNLCSTLGSTAAAACRDGGYVVASATNSGALRRSSVFFNGITLPEGTQEIHLEIASKDGNLTASSEKRAIVVDTVPPVVEEFTFPKNNTSNDQNGTLYFNISQNEGTADGSKMAITAHVKVSGISTKRTVRIYTDKPSPKTLAGSGNTEGETDITLKLPQGLNHLTVSVSDENNNENEASTNSSATVYVDSDLPTVSVASPFKSLYTAEDGILDNKGTKTVADDTLTMAIQVTVADTSFLSGSKVTLKRSPDSASSWQETKEISSNNKQEILTFNVPFIQGSHAAADNTLVATVTDAGGNTASSATVTYHLDYLGAVVSLQVKGISGGGSDCSSGICNIATLTDANNGRISGYTYLDNAVNDLQIVAEGCPCDISLISVLDNGDLEDTVFNSQFAMAEDGMVQYKSAATRIAAIGPGFQPGVKRIVKVKAVDASGNISFSEAITLQLNNVSNALVTVERADPTTAEPIGIFVDDDTYFGPDDQVRLTNNLLATNLAVIVEDLNGGSIANAEVSLTVTSANGSRSFKAQEIDSKGYSIFHDVTLEVSTAIDDLKKNNLIIEVTKNGSSIGHRQISNLIADVSAPTFRWLREGDDIRGGLTQFNISYDESGINKEALWNASLDKKRGDGLENNGFNTTTTALVVEIANIEERQLVTLNTNQDSYPLSGNTTRTSDCGDNKCLAIFSNLTVPNLPAGQKHTLTLSIKDLAGNIATTATNEVIVATVDTISPSPIEAVACIGESTIPATGSSNKYEENDRCNDVCNEEICSRRAGSVTLVWTLPDSERQTSSIANYLIGYIPVGQSELGYLSSCSDLAGSVMDNEIQLMGTVSASLTADDSGLTHYSLKNLPLHQEYCFVVQAYDASNNYSEIAAQSSNRVIPLKSWPTMGEFNGAISDGRDDTSPAYKANDDNNGQSYGSIVSNIGDMDGDGRDDFAVGIYNYNGGKGKVEIFLSSKQQLAEGETLSSPISITMLPTITSNAYLGNNIASFGDLNGDGYADLVIAATALPNPSSGIQSGAVFVYDGAQLASGLIPEQNSDSTKPNILPTTSIYFDNGSKAAFGLGLAMADINNDGVDDLVVGSNIGKTIVAFFGGSSFPTGDLNVSKQDDGSYSGASITINSSTNIGQFLSLTDFNQDGNIDIVSSTTITGNIKVFQGPFNKAVYADSEAITLTKPADYKTIVGLTSYNDLLLMAYTNNESKAQYKLALYQNPNTSLAPASELAGQDFAGNILTQFGKRIAILGDIDGDGQIEVAAASATSAAVALIKLDPYSAKLTLNSFINGTINTASASSSFGFGLANIGNFMGDDYMNALLVSSGIENYGSLYIYW